jgi:hypothetical protein
MRYPIVGHAALVTVAAIISSCGSHQAAPVTPLAHASTQSATGLRHIALVVHAPPVNGRCPAASVMIEPVAAAGITSVTDMVLQLAASQSGARCAATALSAPLAAGRWRLSITLPSASTSCERSIAADVDTSALFEDGKAGCA